MRAGRQCRAIDAHLSMRKISIRAARSDGAMRNSHSRTPVPLRTIAAIFHARRKTASRAENVPHRLRRIFPTPKSGESDRPAAHRPVRMLCRFRRSRFVA
jgi:hypothetical protein